MIDPLQGDYPPYVLSDKIKQLIEQSNRQDEAIITLAEMIEDGSWQKAKQVISAILYPKYD